MAAELNPKFQKRRPLDDVPGLKLDALLEGRRVQHVVCFLVVVVVVVGDGLSGDQMSCPKQDSTFFRFCFFAPLAPPLWPAFW
jgi:hypothetical protein